MVTASSRRAPKYYRSSEAITGTMSGYGFAVGSSGYDDEDRLVNWERDDTNLDQSWSLSLVGDWSSITENSSTQLRTHGSAHQILTAASQSITHDVKGNMTSIPAVLRPGSDPLALSWDFDNRMTGADVDNDSTDDVTYQFDALGRRVQRDDGTDETIFVQNGQQTFADYASGTAATSSDYNYVYASYIDEPVMRGGTGGLRYYHRNQQYSVVALTDGSGTIKERYAYSAYGVLSIFDGSGTARTVTAEGNRYTYTGREWDQDVEVYYYRARMYDPLTGRFCSRDPLGYVDGTSTYAAHFAMSMLDPYGNQTIAPIAPPVRTNIPPGTRPTQPIRRRGTPYPRQPFPGPWRETPPWIEPRDPQPPPDWPINYPDGSTVGPGPNDPGYPGLRKFCQRPEMETNNPWLPYPVRRNPAIHSDLQRIGIQIVKGVPAQTCSAARLAEMQANMHGLCDGLPGSKCNVSMKKMRNPKNRDWHCSMLRRRIQAQSDCIWARIEIQVECYGGKVDAAHADKLVQSQNGLNKCVELRKLNCRRGDPMNDL